MDSRLKLALPAIIGIAAGCGESTAPRNQGPLRVETAYDFPGLGTNFITNFDMAPDGTLWVTSFEGTIFRVRQGQTTRFEGAVILGGAPVNDLFIDGAGRPWVTAGSALAFYDGNTWVRQDPHRSRDCPCAGWQLLGWRRDVSGQGRIDTHIEWRCDRHPHGVFTVISHINSSIAPNESMPQIRQGPDGGIYVLRASQNDIIRVSR